MTGYDTPTSRTAVDGTLLASLAAGASVDQAAAVAHVSPATVARRLRRPEFRAELAAARAATVERAVARLSMASVAAASELLKLTTSAKSEQVRLAGARAILELGQRLREANDVEQRLAALEAALEATADQSRMRRHG